MLGALRLPSPRPARYKGRAVPKPPKYAITSTHAVGRYALGVTWGDKHESIYPFINLRRLCPCLECEATQAVKREPTEAESKLEGVQPLAEASLMLRWADEHETLFLLEELREVCGCALCKGEPNYPITGQ
ncbi:MAG: gamma-butyrobetaine hydroxylase-like domain-containing protein [Candidatus Binatia bacterium]